MDAAIGSVSTSDYTTTASLEHYKNGEYGKRKWLRESTEEQRESMSEHRGSMGG